MSDVVFERGDVTITHSIARFGDTSYPIANIGAVHLVNYSSILRDFGIVMSASGAGLLVFSTSTEQAIGLVMLFVGVPTVWIGLNMGGLKLILRTSSGNQ